MTRHIRWQILLILLGVVLVGVLLTYLAINYTTILRPGHGGTYVEGIVGAPCYINPLLSGYNEVDRDICSLVFSGLTRINARGEVEADLAREWEVTPDGEHYTFYLRSNAYWHDGTPVTVDDVIFTINFLQDPDFAGPAELGANLWRTVKVKKIDQHTVRFTLPEAYAPFLDYTTFGILPVHLLAGTRVDDLSDLEFNLKPVGSGLFQVERVEIEDGVVTSLVLKQFSRYYRGRSYLDRIQSRFYPNYKAALDAYEKGEVEGVSKIPLEHLSRARSLPTLNLFSAQLAEYSIVFLNLNNPDLPFFQEPEVRQALMYALDRQQIVSEMLSGQGLVIDSPIIPGTWAHKEYLSGYAHDQEAAKKLLEEEGWKELMGDDEPRFKGGQRLEFTLLTSDEAGRLEVAQMLAEQWAAVGVQVTVTSTSPSEVHAALESRDFEAALVHVALPGDPDPYPFWHESQADRGQNYAGLTHRRISEALERARVTVDRERREALYDEFQELFVQEVPSLLLYVPIYTYGVDERIKGVQIGPLMHPSDRFRTLPNWWIVHRRVFVSESEAGS